MDTDTLFVTPAWDFQHRAVVEEKACNSWADLQREMEVWTWNKACPNSWTRLAKLLNMASKVRRLWETW